MLYNNINNNNIIIIIIFQLSKRIYIALNLHMSQDMQYIHKT